MPNDAVQSRPPRPDGLVLRPFRGLRYDVPRVGRADALTCPPYDVIDEATRQDLEARSPNNAVHVILPRDQPGADPAAGSRYPRAARTLAGWVDDGVLRRDPEAALYVYEEYDATDGHLQRGLLGALELTRPEEGIVLPHENTMAGPVADRLALTHATAANLEPIFLLYDGGGAASEVTTVATAGVPLLDGLADGIRHRLWAVTDPDQLAAVAADLAPRRAVIADGHHRYATYLRYQQDRRDRGDGAGPWDRGLTYLVDATVAGPRVGPIHRVLATVSVTEAAERAASGMRVLPLDSPPGPGTLQVLDRAAAAGPAFVLAGGDHAYLLTEPDPQRLTAALDPDRSAAWKGLHVTVAHRYLVALLGLPDSEQAVGYEHDLAAALAAADASGGTALLLAATPVASVLAVAAAGERMPRKSTLFTPKPRSGVVLRLLDE